MKKQKQKQEKKHESGMAYDTKKLNRFFALLSVLFLVSVLWLFLDDYLRPWKKIQVEAMRIERAKIQKDLEVASKEVSEKDLATLREERAVAERTIRSRREAIGRVLGELQAIEKEIDQKKITTGAHNAMAAQLQFEYGVAHGAHRVKEAEKLHTRLAREKILLAQSQDALKGLKVRQKTAMKKHEVLQREKTAVEKKIEVLVGKRDLLLAAQKAASVTPLFFLRNAPMIDYLDPTLKIQQIVLEDITDDRYFQHVPKVDRCTTCHTFIDRPGYEAQENPHKTHPHLDLILGRDSPHPIKKIGCTVCHGGEGHRVNDMTAVAHRPRTPDQRAEWIAKYNWHEPHKVPQVMFKKGHTEAGCVKCHGDWEYIPGATVLNEGRRNINRFGCYACHKIKGWEHKKKPGPSLLKAKGKLSKEFFKNWVWNPKVFNRHARMPRFFGLDNNKATASESFVLKNVAEVVAMAEFIWEQSTPYRPFSKYIPGASARGKQIIKEVGCLGCHGVEGLEEESRKVDAIGGPYLTGLGSKVKGDWLVSWLQRPHHYQEDTIMPSFRLSEKEAQDVATHLLSLRNESFERMRFAPLDEKVRDGLLLEYFSAFDTLAVAQAKIEGMSGRQRTLELGRRSVGKYGCYSCHAISGFEERGPIGPELTEIGSKPLTQLGFNHQHDVEHSRDGWIKAHLLNPRRWDEGMDRPFKNLLRMPHFQMTDRQAETITVALLGQVSDRIPLSGIKRLDGFEKAYNEGMKVLSNFQCIGCHQVDGLHGDILHLYDDDFNEGPPRLNGQGHRVQTRWLYHFLDEVTPIRPWIKVRMPSFKLSHEEKDKIVTGFQRGAKQPLFVDFTEGKFFQWEKGEREAAKKLFRSLDCALCHTQGFTSEEPTAPDLHLAHKRLRPSWVAKWLSNPSAILDGTAMPNFWEDGEATDSDTLGGDPKKQIQALTKYIMEIGE